MQRRFALIKHGHDNLEFDYVDFDTAPVPAVTPQTGRVYWGDRGTLEVGLEDGIVLPVGEMTMFYVKNTSGVTITKGSTVMATGTLGASGNITVAKAVANGTVGADFMLGVAADTMSNNEFGYVVHFGTVRGIDTSGTPYGETWADGDVIHFSPTTPGGWVKAEPEAPNLHLPVAIVLNAASGGSGTIFVRMKPGSTLKDLHDVAAASPSNGSLLFWNNANTRWETSSSPLVDSSGNTTAASGTTGMTDGFFYIPAAGGVPTGTPTAKTGRVAMYYDTTNNDFYVYNGAWKKVALT